MNIFFPIKISAENNKQYKSLSVSLQYFCQTVSNTVAAVNKTDTTIAVYPFTQSAKSRINLSDQPLSNFITSETTISLASLKTKNYRLLSRKKIQDLLSEQKLQISDLVNEKTQIKIGNLLGAQYIVTGSIFVFKEYIRFNLQLINVSSGEIATAGSYNISLNDELSLYLPDTVTTIQKEADEKGRQQINIPEYVFHDTFDTLDKTIWVSFSVNDEITLKTNNGMLSMSGKYRKGRLNSINSIETKKFKVKSFAVEIAFSNPTQSADSVSLLIGNSNWYTGSYIQTYANLKKDYSKFYWGWGTKSHSNNDKIIDDVFSRNIKNFYRLKCVYDLEKKTAYGFVNDRLIDSVEDFSFNRTDTLKIKITISETVSETKKDFYMELDNFKASIDFK